MITREAKDTTVNKESTVVHSAQQEDRSGQTQEEIKRIVTRTSMCTRENDVELNNETVDNGQQQQDNRYAN